MGLLRAVPAAGSHSDRRQTGPQHASSPLPASVHDLDLLVSKQGPRRTCCVHHGCVAAIIPVFNCSWTLLPPGAGRSQLLLLLRVRHPGALACGMLVGQEVRLPGVCRRSSGGMPVTPPQLPRATTALTPHGVTRKVMARALPRRPAARCRHHRRQQQLLLLPHRCRCRCRCHWLRHPLPQPPLLRGSPAPELLRRGSG